MEMMTLAGTAQENGAASTHLGQAMAEEVHHLQHSNPLPLGYAALLVPNRANNADLATHQQHATTREGEALVVFLKAPTREVQVGPLIWPSI